MNKQKNDGVWADCFSEGFSQVTYEMFRLDARHRTSNFMRGVADGNIHLKDGLTPQSDNPALDKWVAENDVMLTHLVHDIQSHILSAVQHSLPAHDERQILFKDAAEGLRFSSMEKPQGYKATFVIPMFAHDIGRLLEGRFYDPENNPHDNWVPHSQFSFMLLNKILSKPDYADMPQELKFHYLYAVLAHSGENGQSYMSRAVQTCDRMQLIGAEGFFRALAYGVCLMHAQIQYPDDATFQSKLPSLFDHRSVLSILEYCARNMRQNIGDQHSVWQKRIAVENVALLMMAAHHTPELIGRMFAPELKLRCQFDCTKQAIDEEVLEEASVLFTQYEDTFPIRYSPFDVSSSIIKSLEKTAGAVPLTADMKLSINHAVTQMSDFERKALYQMVCMADVIRAEQDDIDRDICLSMSNDPRGYVAAIANLAITYTSEPAATPAPAAAQQVPNTDVVLQRLALGNS